MKYVCHLVCGIAKKKSNFRFGEQSKNAKQIQGLPQLYTLRQSSQSSQTSAFTINSNFGQKSL